MLLFLIPFLSMRLETSDAGNDPSNTSTYAAYNLLSDGFGPGFNGPLHDRDPALEFESERTGRASA